MNETIKEHSWIPLIVVALASFIIALDATFMNVSISQVVVDLNTDVSTIQSTMSFYTLITAAFMLLSAKLQDIVGKKKLFLIGSALYGLGTFTAAISSSATILFIGWALIEGIAGALMMPATVSIISGTYSGEKRTVALAIVGVMGSVAAAVGPLFGGIMTTFLSWRYGFACELIIVFIILIMRNKIPVFEPTESRSDLDVTGSIISLIGLVLLVLGILSLSKDFNTSIIIIIVGLVALAIFALFEIRRKRNGKVPLLDMDLFKDRNLRGNFNFIISFSCNGRSIVCSFPILAKRVAVKCVRYWCDYTSIDYRFADICNIGTRFNRKIKSQENHGNWMCNGNHWMFTVKLSI